MKINKFLKAKTKNNLKKEKKLSPKMEILNFHQISTIDWLDFSFVPYLYNISKWAWLKCWISVSSFIYSFSLFAKRIHSDEQRKWNLLILKFNKVNIILLDHISRSYSLFLVDYPTPCAGTNLSTESIQSIWNRWEK